MSWFNFLKEEGFFNPEKNPSPIQVKDGVQVPYWESLTYLEKLSNSFKEGKNTEHIDSVIEIIISVCKSPKDNYRTWYFFTKILSNIPNQKITHELLNYIPLWLSASYEKGIICSEICDNLLPKFLINSSTSEDKSKAEIILTYVLGIKERTNKLDHPGESYSLLCDPYHLKHSLIENKLIIPIAQYHSDKITFLIADNLRPILIDYPNGVNIIIKAKGKEIPIKIILNATDLSVYIDNSELFAFSIKDYTTLESSEIRSSFINGLQENQIIFEFTEENESQITWLLNALKTDLFTSYGVKIKKLADRIHTGDKPYEVLALILRELLDEQAQIKESKISEYLNQFLFDKNYELPFFKKIAVYTIGKHWERLKDLFWLFVKESSHFLNYSYQKEIFDLLDENQLKFNPDELTRLETLISMVPESKKAPSEKKYWQHRWYSALKETNKFKEPYELLLTEFNRTAEDFREEGEMKWSNGSVSPLSENELLEMSNEDIVKYIHSFKPKTRWDSPSVSGLSDTLNKVVVSNPDKFSKELHLYQDTYYIYAYQIIIGFKEAWSKKKSFDWDKVLLFCKDYTSQEGFDKGKLALESDNWLSTYGWVLGAVGELISCGTQSDSNAYSLEYLPTTKNLLIQITPLLKVQQIREENEKDYITYSLNSIEGKVLRAVLDYALRRGRNDSDSPVGSKLESDIKSLFQSFETRGIIDFYIVQGMYYEQFMFLDHQWMTQQIKNYYDIEDRLWLPFLQGFVFANPPYNIEVYKLLYPHYERALNTTDIKNTQIIIRHIVAFYFWKYEGLTENSLLLKLINKGIPSVLVELINFISQQEEYVKKADLNTKQNLQTLIFNLWLFLDAKFKNSEGKYDDISQNLSRLIVFESELNEKNTELICDSIPHVHKYFFIHELIENLIPFLNSENPTGTAMFIGKILNKIAFREYIPEIDTSTLITLISFIGKNGQKQVAVEISNKISQLGHSFLIPTYNEISRL